MNSFLEIVILIIQFNKVKLTSGFRKINQDTHKLVQTFMILKKKKKKLNYENVVLVYATNIFAA